MFDGDCGVCTRLAGFARRRLPATVEVRAWQQLDDLAALGLTPDAVTTSSWWVEPGRPPLGGARGISAALGAMGRGWRLLARLIRAPGVSLVADRVYLLVALNRHRLPGSSSACRVPGR